MIVASQLNHAAMILPVAIPPPIFKQYDLIVKEFLWEGKKPRIEMSKMWSPKDRRSGSTKPEAISYFI